MNLTPNSFSDGNLHFQKLSIKEFLIQSDFDELIYDFGMESTAPMNQSIDIETEMARFERFFKDIESYLQDSKKSPMIISIDTYRPAFFQYAYELIKVKNHSAFVIFNDVSGVVDDELIHVLKSCPDSLYVYTHNRIANRLEMHNHMKFASENPQVIDEILKSFEKVKSLFVKHNLLSRLIFDPGFGFSKTLHENWQIIKKFNSFEKKYIELEFKNIPLVIGLSKKSFLKKAFEADPDPLSSSEFLHFEIIKDLLKNSSLSFIFRVHDFLLPNLAQKSLEFEARIEEGLKTFQN